MILEWSPQLLNGVQLWQSGWELEKMPDHPCFLLLVVVLDEKPSPRVALLCSWEGVLHKQVSIALCCQRCLGAKLHQGQRPADHVWGL